MQNNIKCDKIINLNGINNIELVEGTNQWYWATDYCFGDLYEAEELFNEGHEVECNRLVFVKYPEGEVIEPVLREKGQYFGTPVFDDGCMFILLANFLEGKIYIKRYQVDKKEVDTMAELSRSDIDDCYNLMLRVAPVFLSRNDNNGKYQILWPEKSEFAVEKGETVYRRENDILISNCWYEDPDYREEEFIRKYPTGEKIECIRGTFMDMPDGQRWLIQ